MQIIEPLVPGEYYHIYNRGINGENIFRETKNYSYFLKLYTKHIADIADTYCYCLLKNHFHILVKIKEENIKTPAGHPVSNPEKYIVNELPGKKASKHFSNLFNAYAQGINKTYKRTGGLFETPFRRKLVNEDHYFTWLVWYIHSNAQRHKIVDDFRLWPHSSYHSILSNKPTNLKREELMVWFDDVDYFVKYHIGQKEDLDNLMIEFD